LLSDKRIKGNFSKSTREPRRRKIMESRAKILGHPILQMLIPFPFGLLATAVIFDVIYLIWGNPAMATASYWMIAAGVIGGFIAAPFGLIDWLAIPKGTRARRYFFRIP
jgi:uncharacterized membrane protein